MTPAEAACHVEPYVDHARSVRMRRIAALVDEARRACPWDAQALWWLAAEVEFLEWELSRERAHRGCGPFDAAKMRAENERSRT